MIWWLFALPGFVLSALVFFGVGRMIALADARTTHPPVMSEYCGLPVWSKTGGGYNGIDGRCCLEALHEGECEC